MLDAIVVGAGPGGSAAAYHFARRGRRVLLIDARQFPRDKSCGDGLTRPAVALLEEMGVLPELSGAQRVRGVRVTMHGRGTRDYRYPEPSHGIVIPRLALDDILRRRTVEAGAELRERLSATRLIYSGGAVCGVELSDGTSLRASVVLAADGAASALARDAGLSTGAQMGFAIRGYYEGIGELDAMLEIKAAHGPGGALPAALIRLDLPDRPRHGEYRHRAVPPVARREFAGGDAVLCRRASPQQFAL
jgi:flavin-dependent dehydrogenase